MEIICVSSSLYMGIFLNVDRHGRNKLQKTCKNSSKTMLLEIFWQNPGVQIETTKTYQFFSTCMDLTSESISYYIRFVVSKPKLFKFLKFCVPPPLEGSHLTYRITQEKWISKSRSWTKFPDFSKIQGMDWLEKHPRSHFEGSIFSSLYKNRFKRNFSEFSCVPAINFTEALIHSWVSEKVSL